MTGAGEPDGIVASDVSVAYDGEPLLTGVDLTVAPATMIGVLGPSGIGKTSLLRTLAGMRPPVAGTLTYDGADRPLPGSVAVLAQHPRQVCNPRWTLSAIITEPARIRGERADAHDWIDRVGLDESLLDRHPSQVSDGQLQRACLARVLVQSPRYLLCDEPTSMLDPVAARAVIDLVAGLVDEGVGTVLVSHNRGLVEHRCSEVLDLTPRESLL